MIDILNDLNNRFTYIIRINCDEDLFNQSMLSSHTMAINNVGSVYLLKTCHFLI